MDYVVKRIGKMAFHARTPSGHDIHMDAKEASGGDGSAPTPMETVLAADGLYLDGYRGYSEQDEGRGL